MKGQSNSSGSMSPMTQLERQRNINRIIYLENKEAELRILFFIGQLFGWLMFWFIAGALLVNEGFILAVFLLLFMRFWIEKKM